MTSASGPLVNVVASQNIDLPWQRRTTMTSGPPHCGPSLVNIVMVVGRAVAECSRQKMGFLIDSCTTLHTIDFNAKLASAGSLRVEKCQWLMSTTALFLSFNLRTEMNHFSEVQSSLQTLRLRDYSALYDPCQGRPNFWQEGHIIFLILFRGPGKKKIINLHLKLE